MYSFKRTSLRIVPNCEDYSLPLSKVRYIDNSFDSISMLSSVSNRFNNILLKETVGRNKKSHHQRSEYFVIITNENAEII